MECTLVILQQKPPESTEIHTLSLTQRNVEFHPWSCSPVQRPHPSADGAIKYTAAEETKKTDLANTLPCISCLEEHILLLDAYGNQFMACTATVKMAYLLSVASNEMKSFCPLEAICLI